MSALNVDSFASASLSTAMMQESQQKMANLKARAHSGNTDRNAAVEKARQVASEFESVFLSQMLKPMFAPLDTAPPFGGGQAEEMWRGLMIDE
ncbi:MAG: hypothetical protein OQJ87_04120, partial [Rhodospirillales bacterium]|nr:hypothetical protein [Rhodospirillales bacterium]